jgi:DNA-binding beta-propeller fold protein YncE
MRLGRLHGSGLAILVVAQALTGCGGGSPQMTPALSTQQNRPALTSWMSPSARRRALLYISDEDAGKVLVYSYPDLTLTGTLTGFTAPTGLCVNPKTGAVWVTDILQYKVTEFEHGGATPVRTLDTNVGFDDACAVDPVSGDLAVANNTVQGSDPGNLMVFKRARGKPQVYSDPKVFLVDFVTYDGGGNLFFDGFAYKQGSHFRLDELPAGAHQLVNIAWTGPKIRFAGGVQYEGSTLAVADARKPVIYQTTDGTVTGTTALKKGCNVEQFFIDGGQLIAPSYCGSKSAVLVYNYPAGGAPVKTVTGFTYAFGAVVSR